MVSRVEWFLGLLLGLALVVGFTNQKEILQVQREKAAAKKEIELGAHEVREVNATSVLNTFRARHAVMIRRTWYLDDFHFVNPDIRSLEASKAVRKPDLILLEGNVTMVRRDNAVYQARLIRYDQKRKILRSYGPFRAFRGEDYATGQDFVYDVPARRTTARKVFAHYVLRENDRALGNTQKR